MPRAPFTSVLIANRGEIALRLIRACRELGLKSIAVATDPDRNSLHAEEADQVVHLGDRKAYLDPKALLAAARESKAGAIHPGYGFLSENPAFAESCEKAGLAWIGPPPSAMRAVGNKVSAKALARKAGVPVIPEGKDAGFPLLVKASAGGGGRGQRIVRHPAELAEAQAAAGREALASFGDATVFTEKYLESPRHVEFQILADPKGKVLHLGERECSVQRRHQKVIEESPSPALDEAMRSEMGAAAVRLAEAAGYRSLGTVEFLVSGREYFFLEVNARLQVEHPVTEAVLGLDLAQWQIRMALGEPFPFFQNQLKARGHAIEARVCAEDPDAGFLPTGGRVLALELPRIPGLRWDSALRGGDEVGSDYDSLLAKAVAWAEDRAAAVRRLDSALERTVLLGLRHNVGFLRFVLAHPGFAKGEYSTGFVEGTAAAWKGRDRTLPPEAAALLASLRERRVGGSASDPWGRPGPWLP